MKITVDPMPALRQARADAVNKNFAEIYKANAFRYAAHERKRAIAVSVKSGEQAPDSFQSEAVLRGISVEQLVDLVVSKGSELDGYELQRQKVMDKIQKASTVEELDQVKGEF